MTDESVPAETLCTECGHRVDEPPNFCPECGNDEWKTRAKYDFERDVDLPFVFPVSFYDDNYELWREFIQSAFGVYELDEMDIANCPALPRMKYMEAEVWYKLTEDLDLDGPYASKQEARDE